MGRIVPSGLKSVQRGTISVSGSLSATATISAVNTAKSELRVLGWTNTTAANTARVELTSSTVVTAYQSVVTGTTDVSWELSEFY